jgi:hypothetical protein
MRNSGGHQEVHSRSEPKLDAGSSYSVSPLVPDPEMRVAEKAPGTSSTPKQLMFLAFVRHFDEVQWLWALHSANVMLKCIT